MRLSCSTRSSQWATSHLRKSQFLILSRNFPAQWRYLPPDPNYKSPAKGRDEKPVVAHLTPAKTNLQLPDHMVQHQRLMDLPHIRELLDANTPKDLAGKMSLEEMQLQVAKYAYWLRSLRRQMHTTNVKAHKKKTRKLIKVQTGDVDKLNEAIYWKSWIPGTLAYQH